MGMSKSSHWYRRIDIGQPTGSRGPLGIGTRSVANEISTGILDNLAFTTLSLFQEPETDGYCDFLVPKNEQRL